MNRIASSSRIASLVRTILLLTFLWASVVPAYAQSPTWYNTADFCRSTISSGSLNNTATPITITVSSATGWPAVPFVAVVDPNGAPEAVLVTAKSGTSWTMTRGTVGTAIVHLGAPPIVLSATSALFNQMHTAVDSVWTAINLKASLASPAFTGHPTGVTETAGNNSTRLATTAYIDAGYVGSTAVTTLGTIATGTWSATAITVAKGGTGNTSTTAYAVQCGGTSSTGALQAVSGVGTSGQVLTSNGAATLPTWQAAAGGGSLTSGTTTIASAASTASILYNSSGTLQTSANFKYDGTNLTLLGGYAGIGVDATGGTNTLDVHGPSGDANTSSVINAGSNTGTNDHDLRLGAVAGSNTAGYSYIQAAERGVSQNRILALNPTAGRVGIGNTAPAEILDVTGNIKASGTFIGATATQSAGDNSTKLASTAYVDARFNPDWLPWLIPIDIFNGQTASVGFVWKYVNGNMVAWNSTSGIASNTGTDPVMLYNASLTNNNGSPAQNDYVEFPIVMGAGTWSIRISCYMDNSSGIATFKLDGSSVGTIDCYKSSSVKNVFGEITGITVATTGKKTLRMQMATKNGSSSGYVLTIHSLTCVRTN